MRQKIHAPSMTNSWISLSNAWWRLMDIGSGGGGKEAAHGHEAFDRPRLPRPGRNDSCQCGSGRKSKKCCYEACERLAANGVIPPASQSCF